MANYTDRLGDQFDNEAFDAGDPTDNDSMNALRETQRFLRHVKAPFVFGESDTGTPADDTHESGHIFHSIRWFADASAGAYIRPEETTRVLVNTDEYEGVIGCDTNDTFTDTGMKYRVIVIEFTYTAQSGLSDLVTRMPGMLVTNGNTCYDYELFYDYDLAQGGIGAEPETRMFYSGAGSAGGASNYDAVWSSGNHELKFWVDSTSGDLKATYTYSGGSDHYFLAIAAKIFVSPKLVAG